MLDFDTSCELTVNDTVVDLFALFVGNGVVVDSKPSSINLHTALDARDLRRRSVVLSFRFCVGIHLYRSWSVFKPI